MDFVDKTVKTFQHLPVALCHLVSLSLSLSPQGEIRAVAFNEVADKMQGLLEMGQVSFSLSFSLIDFSLFLSEGVLCVQG